MSVEIKNPGPKLSESDLKAFEKKVGHEMPGPYRKFLLEFNGGEVFPEYFKVPGYKYNQSLVNWLKGIEPGTKSIDLGGLYEMMEDRFPRGFIAIGDDPGGNSILIGLEGSHRGKIYFFDHENEPDDSTENLEDYSNIFLLANDLDEFLNNLKSENDL